MLKTKQNKNPHLFFFPRVQSVIQCLCNETEKAKRSVCISVRMPTDCKRKLERMGKCQTKIGDSVRITYLFNTDQNPQYKLLVCHICHVTPQFYHQYKRVSDLPILLGLQLQPYKLYMCHKTFLWALLIQPEKLFPLFYSFRSWVTDFY